MRYLANRGNYRTSPLSVPEIDLEKRCYLERTNFKLNFENSTCAAIQCETENDYYVVPEFLDMYPCNRSDNRLSKSASSAVCYKGTCVFNKTLKVQAGAWGPWTIWSPCLGHDVIGYKVKHRKCDDPSPMFGGQYCQGYKMEFKVCNNKTIGCDDKFFSAAKRDKCGICNGDNTKCLPFSVKRTIKLTQGKLVE
ncbi:unnamed protein product [Gordionus sp. m RMFG-2023]